jgi:hypothetical protein
MNEHHRNLPPPIGLQADEVRGGAMDKIAIEKARQFARPHLRIAETEGERGARIRLERDHLPRNRHVARFEGRIDLQARAQVALCETGPSGLDPQERGHRDLDIGFNLETVFVPRRGGIGGERRAESRPAIAHQQAGDAQLIGGRKVG